MIATTLEMANEGLEYGSIVRYIFSFPLPLASSVLLFLCRTYVHPYSYATYNHPTLYAFFTIKNQTYLLEFAFPLPTETRKGRDIILYCTHVSNNL